MTVSITTKWQGTAGTQHGINTDDLVPALTARIRAMTDLSNRRIRQMAQRSARTGYFTYTSPWGETLELTVREEA